ncbi:TetR/AcrR family transcriptional regulator [Dactylosporangium sp. NPDC048998]|uniref:TetR/AcrR family transcriptional regulator n=1 Tax=Dactylosporangium sp. NPDC048998 TaxID=3363976 RepID=UPI003717CD9E
MPRPIDVHARRLEITNAAIRILARGGTPALTLKSLAEELGGSITLVTHFFATRKELFAAVTDELVTTYEPMLQELDEGASGPERIYNLLMWMVPSDAEDIETEAGRIALIPHRGEQQSIQYFFDAMEQRMRSLIRERLVGLVPDDELDSAVGFLRAMTNGITLSAVEHPDLWPAERVRTVVETALRGLGIAEKTRALEAG